MKYTRYKIPLVLAIIAIVMMAIPAVLLAAPNDGQSHVYQCSATIPAGGGPPSGGCTEPLDVSAWVSCVQSPVVFVPQPNGTQVANYTISCTNGPTISSPVPELSKTVIDALKTQTSYNDGMATWTLVTNSDGDFYVRTESPVLKIEVFQIQPDKVVKTGGYDPQTGWY